MPAEPSGVLVRSELPLPLVHRGKVREMYDGGPGRLLMVASDRVSAFDVVLDRPIPRKGEVLAMITAWWLEKLNRASASGAGAPGLEGLRHHAITADPDEIVAVLPGLEGSRAQWARRTLLVRRSAPIPIECVVRGYLAGSAWREYSERGTLAGEPLPEGLRESERLDPPLFSPATKATRGHDENIPFARVRDTLGDRQARRLRDLSLEIYRLGARVAAERGILLADTKFEFGTDDGEEPILIDEVLTPDSSRYWPREGYREGLAPPSLDKQPVRDYLDGVPGWDRRPPAPPLPDAVVQAATGRYLEIFRRLVGVELDAYAPPGARALGGGSP